MRAFGLQLLAFGTAGMTWTLLTPGNQVLVACLAGGAIGWGASLAAGR